MPKKLDRFLLILLTLPVVLMGVLRVIARERPRSLARWNYPVERFDFPEVPNSVCVEYDGSSECYDQDSGERIRNPLPALERVKRYGALHFQKDIHGTLYGFDGSAASSKVEDDYAQVAFSPDKRFVTVATNAEVCRWKLPEGTLLWKTPIEQPKTNDSYQMAQAVSPDGTLCTISMDGSGAVAIVNCRTGKVTARLPQSRAPQSGFAPDSQSIWLWQDDVLSFFDARSARLLWKTKATPKNAYVEVDFTPKGELGLPRTNGFDFLDPRSGKVKRHLNAPSLSQMEAWNFSPDGQRLWWSTPKHEIFWRDLN